jgi:hypothetical protein
MTSLNKACEGKANLVSCQLEVQITNLAKLKCKLIGTLVIKQLQVELSILNV